MNLFLFIFYLILSISNISYFIIYILRLGTNNKFVYFFLIMSIVFLAFSIFHFLLFKNIIQTPKWLMVIVYGLIAVCLVIFTTVQSKIIVAANSTPSKDADYVVILGARVVGNRLTQNLKYRLNASLDYYKDNPNVKFVVSGGRGPGENITEADAMAGYLMENGIDKNKIIIENTSKNTEENMRFSKELIIRDGGDIKNNKVIVCSNSFHLYRSKRLMEKKGFKNVDVIGAKTKTFTIPLSYIRESFSVVYYKTKGRI